MPLEQLIQIYSPVTLAPNDDQMKIWWSISAMSVEKIPQQFTYEIKRTAHCWMGGGGYSQMIFWKGVQPKVWNPYPYLKFSSSKNGWFDWFFKIFANQDPFLRVFRPQKWLILQVFCNFCEMAQFNFFLDQMGSMSKNFGWKSNPFGQHIPVCFNMWVPPWMVHQISGI